MTAKHFYIVTAAYNEEKTLARSVDSVFRSAAFHGKSDVGASCDLIICHNGCTDRTPLLAKTIRNRYSGENFRIHIISSPKGMVLAQTASVEYIRMQKNNDPIIFFDADSFMDEGVIHAFLGQFKRHPSLRAVGAKQVPIPYSGASPIKRMWDKVFNCRAYYPRSEIAVRFATQFHPYADSDPQPDYVEFEKKSKIYFHGRCFALKDQSVWDVPKNHVGEDTYLDRSINYRFEPGSIRTLFTAKVYFQPITSLRVFARTFYRVYRDLKALKQANPQYNEVREYSKTRLDWDYIKSLPLKWRLAFRIYSVIRQICHFLFKHNLIYSKKSAMDIWSYEKK